MVRLNWYCCELPKTLHQENAMQIIYITVLKVCRVPFSESVMYCQLSNEDELIKVCTRWVYHHSRKRWFKNSFSNNLQIQMWTTFTLRISPRLSHAQDNLHLIFWVLISYVHIFSSKWHTGWKMSWEGWHLTSWHAFYPSEIKVHATVSMCTFCINLENVWYIDLLISLNFDNNGVNLGNRGWIALAVEWPLEMHIASKIVIAWETYLSKSFMEIYPFACPLAR